MTIDLDEIARRAAVFAVELYAKQNPVNRICTKKELAQHFGVSEPTINRWMKAGMPYFGGGRPRYNKEECEKWKYEQQSI